MKKHEDLTHLWGNFHELVLTNNSMSRIIKFYDKGFTSVHKHDVEEYLFILDGSVKILMGPDPENLKEYMAKKGDFFHLVKNEWHTVGAETVNENGYAYAVEYTTGEVKDGTYEIVRHKPSVPSPYSKNWIVEK